MTNNESAELPSFDNVADTLACLGALASPAEVHGLACGYLCGGGRYTDQEWLKTALEFLDAAREPEADAEEIVIQLYRATLQQLRDQELGIRLLLPEDEVEISQRVAALGHWCQGFLSGFGTSGVNADMALSGETADALHDFAAFVQISPEADDSKNAEKDYLEIVEYVRLAALSIFMEFGVLAEEHMPADYTPTVH